MNVTREEVLSITMSISDAIARSLETNSYNEADYISAIEWLDEMKVPRNNGENGQDYSLIARIYFYLRMYSNQDKE